MRLDLAQDIARARAHGLCEGCRAYQGGALDFAHRLARGMGGVHRAGADLVNTPENGLMLCRPCHNRTEAADTWQECIAVGWRIERGKAADPLGTPALIHTVNGSGWWYLTRNGGYLWADLPITYRITRRNEES